MTLTKASNILKELLRRYGLTEDIYALYDIWDKEAGKISKQAKMMGKRGKTLLIRAENSVYKQEIRLRKKELIKKINGNFGKDIINEIEFV